MMNIFSMLEEKYLYQRRPINFFDELKTNFHSMDKQKIQESKIQKIQFIQIFNLSFNVKSIALKSISFRMWKYV